MTKRNVTHERYNNLYDKKAGKSRKSASSAKPLREAAASVYIESNKKTKKEKKAEERARAEEERRIDEAVQARLGGNEVKNEKIKKWRRIWWVSLVIAILCTLASWTVRERVPEVASGIIMALAYVFIIFALYVDLGIIRKERKKIAEMQTADPELKRIYKEETKRVRAEMRAQAREEKNEAKENPDSKNADKTDKLKEKKKIIGRKNNKEEKESAN